MDPCSQHRPELSTDRTALHASQLPSKLSALHRREPSPNHQPQISPDLAPGSTPPMAWNSASQHTASSENSSAALMRIVRAWVMHPSPPNGGIRIQHHPTKHKSSPRSTVANARLSGVQHLPELSRDMAISGEHADLMGTDRPQHPAQQRSLPPDPPGPPRISSANSCLGTRGGGAEPRRGHGVTPGSTPD
jgi:hypothetical protein